jgi:hypothetical protein
MCCATAKKYNPSIFGPIGAGKMKDVNINHEKNR